MSKIFLILFFLGLLNSCSSNSKKVNNDGVTANSTQSESRAGSQEDEISQMITEADGEQRPEAKDQLYGALSQAIMTKDDTRVEKAAAQLLSKNPNDVKTLNALAMYHAQKNRFSLAEMILGKALKIKENSPEVYSNLGWISFQKGEKKEAITFFRKALEINSDDYWASANLGSYFAEVKDYDRAQKHLELVYQKGTKELGLINNYAISLMMVGEQADAVFEQGMQVNSSNINFLVNYCIYLVYFKKDLTKAKELLSKINFVGVTSDRRETIRSLENIINSNKESIKR